MVQTEALWHNGVCAQGKDAFLLPFFGVSVRERGCLSDEQTSLL